MFRTFSVIFGAILSMALLILGFWLWEHPARLLMAADVERPELLLWAIRLAALAAVAGAQVVIMIFVTGRFYRRRLGDWIARTAGGGVCVGALIAAAACGWLSQS